ncbi:hypothetical protein DSO57_1029393 [Entomophthora muscae]|uniref:Uncharacterized protein n=1 Tax=Entomophthora muscae TaxID=34485 RepID=A0ACC2TNE0_9FUNG|nr:hypothetical protein DSO57_1029393 [Entomophthora muscae]
MLTNMSKTEQSAWTMKMLAVRHTTTSLHLSSIVQSLEYATQRTLPLPRTYALHTLLQASESFVPRASPVQDPSLSRILDMLQSENAALRAQIAGLTKQLTLFLSRENQRTKPAQPKPSAQAPCRKPWSQHRNSSA